MFLPNMYQNEYFLNTHTDVQQTILLHLYIYLNLLKCSLSDSLTKRVEFVFSYKSFNATFIFLISVIVISISFFINEIQM